MIRCYHRITHNLKQEKDKNLASMSIYRYNAIHRKVESICKTCMKREKAETEFKRKTAILGTSLIFKVLALNVCAYKMNRKTSNGGLASDDCDFQHLCLCERHRSFKEA
jgi:hypothetical protein